MDFLKSLVFIAFFTNIFVVELVEAKNVLKIAGWDVYADPKMPNKTIGYKSFEKKMGVEIQFKALSTLDEIVAVAESDKKFDLYIISNEGIKMLHDMGLVQSLNLSKITNYQTLHPNLKYSSWGQFLGKVYAVPLAWGPTGLMFSKNKIKNPKSWNVLWDPKYKGRVAMWDDVSMIWTTALSLGYKNVYSLTKKQLNEVKAKLLKYNQLGNHYYKGGGDDIELAKKGKIIAYNSWYNPSSRLKKAGKEFAMVIPKEGAVGMFDSFLISKKSKKVELAHRYINHQLNIDVQKMMINITGLAPSNIETLSVLKPAVIKSLHLDEPNFFSKMLLWDHMPRKNLYELVLKEVRSDRKKYK